MAEERKLNRQSIREQITALKNTLIELFIQGKDKTSEIANLLSINNPTECKFTLSVTEDLANNPKLRAAFDSALNEALAKNEKVDHAWLQVFAKAGLAALTVKLFDIKKDPNNPLHHEQMHQLLQYKYELKDSDIAEDNIFRDISLSSLVTNSFSTKQDVLLLLAIQAGIRRTAKNNILLLDKGLSAKGSDRGYDLIRTEPLLMTALNQMPSIYDKVAQNIEAYIKNYSNKFFNTGRCRAEFLKTVWNINGNWGYQSTNLYALPKNTVYALTIYLTLRHKQVDKLAAYICGAFTNSNLDLDCLSDYNANREEIKNIFGSFLSQFGLDDTLVSNVEKPFWQAVESKKGNPIVVLLDELPATVLSNIANKSACAEVQKQVPEANKVLGPSF